MISVLNEEIMNSLNDIDHLPPSDQIVGNIFLKKADFLKVYKVYCAGYDAAVESFKKLKGKNKEFSRFLSDQLIRTDGLSLDAFLIKPVQRVCKYPLLLEELLKKTNPSHKDHKPLSQSLEKVKKIVNEINASNAFRENQQKVADIQKTFVNFFWKDEGLDIIDPTRLYVREGPFSKPHAKKKTFTLKFYHYYMFNDLLVYGRLITSKFLPSCAIKLEDISHVRDFVDEKSLKKGLTMQVAGKTFVMLFNSPEESTAFHQDIQSQITERRKKLHK